MSNNPTHSASSQPSRLRRVLITGAQGALGQKVVDRFLAEPAVEVTGTYWPEPSPNADLRVKWLKVNLGDPGSVAEALRGKGFDGLVHCAGGFRFSKLEGFADADFEFLMKSNLFSAFYLVREVLPQMKSQNFGRILFLSSKSTLHPSAGFGLYGASKVGINVLTESLADEVKDFDITVNALLPSIIDTPANRKDMPNSDFSKWVRPEQLAELIFQLFSSLGTPVTGALIPVAGRV